MNLSRIVLLLVFICASPLAGAQEDAETLTVTLLPGPGEEPGLATLTGNGDTTQINMNIPGDLPGSTLPGRIAELRAGDCEQPDAQVIARTHVRPTEPPRSSITAAAGVFSGYGEFDVPLETFREGDRSLAITLKNPESQNKSAQACGELP